MKNEGYIENPYIKYWIEDGILYGEYKFVDVNSIEIAQICVRDRLALTNDKAMPYFLDARHIKSISKEARDYFVTEESEKCLLAGAILVDSSVTTILGNFFLKISKPRTPAKIFTDKQKALEWLSKFKEAT